MTAFVFGTALGMLAGLVLLMASVNVWIDKIR